MVITSADQKLRLRNFDARHGRKSKQEQWSRVERAQVALKEEKEKVFQWKAKGQCSKGDQCSVWNESDLIVHQNRHRKPLHPLSHQCHEVEAGREKEASEAKVRLAEFFDNRADTI